MSALMQLGSGWRQVAFGLAFVSWVAAFCFWTGALHTGWAATAPSVSDSWALYGGLATLALVVIRLLSLLAVPQTLLNILGLTAYNAFPDRHVPLKSSPLLAPFICVRVVTRGVYPKLVKETVSKNLQTLADVGVENFVIQVVTDAPIHVADGHPRVRELVVPSSYHTKSGALNKSRALQYALEEEVNILSDDDWLVHLDEETLLTESSLRGILNFVADGKHPFGQGLITYANSPVHFKSLWTTLQNRICTVADSFRVADDMGKLRCQFKMFHKPLFGWKGSFVVTKAVAERKVTFDNGPEGSKAEDAFFAMLAMDAGYTFDFIEGEMHEKSPFTFSDFFKQRKRWMQGIYMVVASPLISVRTKALLAVSLASWLTLPLTTLNLVLSQKFPLSVSPLTDFLLGVLGATALFMYGYGYVKQHPVKRYSWLRLLIIIPEIVLSSLLSICVENVAVCTMWFGDWYDFYIVQKEVDDIGDPEKRLVQTV